MLWPKCTPKLHISAQAWALILQACGRWDPPFPSLYVRVYSARDGGEAALISAYASCAAPTPCTCDRQRETGEQRTKRERPGRRAALYRPRV